MIILKKNVIVVVNVLSALLLLSAVGCGGGDDNWYEKSSNLKNRKNTYIERQVELGMSREEARKSWRGKRSKEQTEGTFYKSEMSLSGDELRRALDE